MTKTFIALAALLSVAQPALAETIVHDGTTYTYTVEQRGKATVISGRNANTREPFRLRVVGTRVNGTVGFNRVSFSTREVVSLKSPRAPAEIAAR